ncbi:MAG: hypothetical protein WC551_01840 [Patescibacteria group bacterium]
MKTMILLIRLLPFFVGLLEAVLFWWQKKIPGAYPWLVAAAFVALPLSALIIAGRRVRFWDLMEKMAPTFLFVAVLGFALLLLEGNTETIILTAMAAIASFVSLELLFLLARDPGAYPVNGLSHVNIAYVPLSIWYAVSTSTGLLVFLHSDGIWHVALCAVLGIVLFRTTGHPGATRQQNRIWMAIGGMVGAETGLLGLLLPVSMLMQGLVAAIVICGALRVRRYLYDPKPSRRLAWTESIVGVLLFIVSLVSAKWI